MQIDPERKQIARQIIVSEESESQNCESYLRLPWNPKCFPTLKLILPIFFPLQVSHNNFGEFTRHAKVGRRSSRKTWMKRWKCDIAAWLCPRGVSCLVITSLLPVLRQLNFLPRNEIRVVIQIASLTIFNLPMSRSRKESPHDAAAAAKSGKREAEIKHCWFFLSVCRSDLKSLLLPPRFIRRRT